MKKKKAGDHAPADFRNNPFKPLKGFAPRPSPAAKAAASPYRKEASSEDDEALFLRAMSGARRIEQEEADAGPKAGAPKVVRQDAAGPEDGELFLRAMQKIGTSFRGLPPAEEEPDQHERRSPSSRMKQLKRGSIRIAEELDLHGHLRDEALARLEGFIAAAYSRGAGAVLVITGKGINSAEGPVLKGAVADWLSGRGKAMVSEFSPAPRDKGGSGALVVFLKKRD